MRKQLDYRSLIKNWMRVYGLTVGASNRLFASVWLQMQSQKIKALDESEEKNGKHVEQLGGKGKK